LPRHLHQRERPGLGESIAAIRIVVEVGREGVYSNGLGNALIEVGSNFRSQMDDPFPVPAAIPKWREEEAYLTRNSATV
jgi:hypothetical protein